MIAYHDVSAKSPATMSSVPTGVSAKVRSGFCNIGDLMQQRRRPFA
jgi:hypothetical protein